MERKSSSPPTSYWNPHLLQLPQDLLAGIGAVALTFNACEESIDDILAIGSQLPFDAKEMTTRLNGIDGKTELVKIAAKAWNVPAEMQETLAAVLGEGEFKLYKKWRDGVIHVRVMNDERRLGFVVERQNRAYDVLLTTEALDGVAKRLDSLMQELEQIKLAYRERVADAKRDPGDPQKGQLASWCEERLALARTYRNQRLSLPPLPAFPEEF